MRKVARAPKQLTLHEALGTEPANTYNWEGAAQTAGEQHLERCLLALACEEGICDCEGTHQESPAAAPFCGCPTCVVREVLAASWKHLQWGARNDDS